MYVCMSVCMCVSMYMYLCIYVIPVVPHKAVAEVSKIGNRLVVVNHGWQSESTDGPKGGWSCVFWSGCAGCTGCSGHLTTSAGCSCVAQL